MSELTINRVPESTNNSLRAWSAADELLVSFLEEKNPESVTIYNDSFGYLSAHAAPRTVYLATDLKSQEKAIAENFKTNKLNSDCIHPLSLVKKAPKKAKLGLMKIPKSLDLFEMFLSHSAQNIYKTGFLACGFMTRNFTKQMLEIASEYFEVVEQSLSKKKARLLILSKPKNIEKKAFLNTIPQENGEIKQYFGVFSAKRIDFATQFLIENLEPPEQVETVLDLACGNGILAKEVSQLFPEAEYHLVDDSNLAIESAKLNLQGDNFNFYHNNNLEDLNSGTMDYIVCNPPFHVEYEIDISLPLRLFRAAQKKLTREGKFQLVANTHLNYKPHLEKIFKMVKVVYDNDKFIVYSCFNAYPDRKRDERWNEDAI
ncbi:MAG: methyltransferase [Flavobacteriales bacterium]